MTDIKGERLFINLSVSQARKRLMGFGHGVRKVYSDGKNQAVIIHTATAARKLIGRFRVIVFRNPSMTQLNVFEEDRFNSHSPLRRDRDVQEAIVGSVYSRMLD